MAVTWDQLELPLDLEISTEAEPAPCALSRAKRGKSGNHGLDLVAAAVRPTF
jgi:hypothetical protein